MFQPEMLQKQCARAIKKELQSRIARPENNLVFKDMKKRLVPMLPFRRFLCLAICSLVFYAAVPPAYAQLFGPDRLIEGARDGDIKTVRAALLKGSHVNVRDTTGLTGLMHAAKIGSLDISRFLLAQGALIDLVDRQGNTALILAASRGHGDIVDLLIANGAAPEAENNRGETALIRAAQNGHSFTVDRLLRAKGVMTDSADYTGRTAYDHAVLRGHRRIARRIKRHGVTTVKMK